MADCGGLWSTVMDCSWLWSAEVSFCGSLWFVSAVTDKTDNSDKKGKSKNNLPVVAGDCQI